VKWLTIEKLVTVNTVMLPVCNVQDLMITNVGLVMKEDSYTMDLVSQNVQLTISITSNGELVIDVTKPVEPVPDIIMTNVLTVMPKPTYMSIQTITNLECVSDLVKKDTSLLK
jgi:hypothetical protein